MSDPLSYTTAATACAGLAFGLLYFAILRRSVALLAARRGWFGPLILTLGRLGAAAVFLGLAAKLGAAPLLAAFVGFLAARALAVRINGRTG